MKKIKIVIIDSGISTNAEYADTVEETYCLLHTDNQYHISKCGLGDKIGHGTAVSHIIYRENQYIELINLKVCEEQTEVQEDGLIYALQYIYDNIETDIINISAGLTYLYKYCELENICNKLYKKGIVIISAFDNSGAISYPAAFDSVIGVDIMKEPGKKGDLCWIKNSIVDIEIADVFYRTIWNGKREILRGTSFACGYVTGIVSKYICKSGHDRRKKETILKSISNKIKKVEMKQEFTRPEFRIDKAVIFPVNKETHAILRYKDLLSFKLVGVYDERVSGNIGRELFGEKIKSFDQIDWETFDTFILSCTTKLSSITKKDYARKIIRMAKEKGKNVYTFEDIDYEYKNCYYPLVKKDMVPYYNQQKVHKITIPVVGVFGTSSSQGKFSLQLSMIRELSRRGYQVGQIATEPSGYLFNSDCVFHFGYNADIELKPWEMIAILNEMVWQVERKGKDILITGCQSGTLHYEISQIRDCAIFQYDFLLGILPDFVILCINPQDEESYISKTINYINSIDEGKVKALVLFPIEVKETLAGLKYQKNELEKSKLKEIGNDCSKRFGLPVYLLNDSEELKKLCNQVENYFGESE